MSDYMEYEEIIADAINEAERFIRRANVVLMELDRTEKSNKYYFGGHYHAAMKRSSMDLSRSLVYLRQVRL